VQQAQNLPALETDAGAADLQWIVDKIVRTRLAHDGGQKTAMLVPPLRANHCTRKQAAMIHE
jgi:hypothetical protein